VRFKNGAPIVDAVAEPDVRTSDPEKPRRLESDVTLKEEQRQTPSTSANAHGNGSTLSWQHLSCATTIASGQHDTLLDGVSGYAQPGKLTAIMSSSEVQRVRTCFITNMPMLTSPF
jgi:hypothetical protein